VKNETTENEAIVATGLTKWFGEGEARVTAVNQVGLIAHFGEMLFIVGPSGSGKTTMLSMISGILRPNAGNVRVKGADIWTLNNDQLADFRLNTIGFVFQDYHLFPRLTTAENVAIPLILKQRNWDEAISEARKQLEIVGLKNRGDMLPVKLSGGEQQRVALARALVNGPRLLLADEPTGDLDETTAGRVFDLITRLHASHGLTSILVTHNLELARRCTRALRLEGGRLAPMADAST
jgi:putative ABC transport system ATP-binding protein